MLTCAVYTPEEDIVGCGMWRDGNVSNGLLRIRKYLRAARYVLMVDTVRPSVPRKAMNSVTFLKLGIQRGREGEGCGEGLVAFPACSVGLSGG